MTEIVHVDQKTIENIFETEGWHSRYGNIADAIFLYQYLGDHAGHISRVYPQDIVDTVRHLIEKEIILKSRAVLESDDAPVSLNYKVPLKSYSDKQGRTVPNLHVELSRNDDATKIYGYLKYFENRHWHYFLQFNVKSEEGQDKGYIPKQNLSH